MDLDLDLTAMVDNVMINWQLWGPSLEHERGLQSPSIHIRLKASSRCSHIEPVHPDPLLFPLCIFSRKVLVGKYGPSSHSIVDNIDWFCEFPVFKQTKCGNPFPLFIEPQAWHFMIFYVFRVIGIRDVFDQDLGLPTRFHLYLSILADTLHTHNS